MTKQHRVPTVVIVGRPNVGKSTLINTLLGEERLIAFDQPGTTRDAVAIDFERGGRPYTLVDTAGLRRRGRVVDMVEKFSAVKTLQAIEDANVCILLLDATDPVSDQDSVIAGHVLEAGRALVIASLIFRVKKRLTKCGCARCGWVWPMRMCNWRAPHRCAILRPRWIAPIDLM